MQESGRSSFYSRIDAHGMTPLWEVLHELVPPSPRTPCVPALWRYDTVRPFLMESGELITAQEAVRRVLVFENPALRGSSSITHSLYAGLQLILPGEEAPSHRHTQSAIRFIVEGEGAFTAVDGEHVDMHPGDFIVTPAWTFHDHGNTGSDPVVWLDGLDIPMVRFFDSGFAENAPSSSPAPAKAGNGRGFRLATFSYPYATALGWLEKLKAKGVHPSHGVKMAYRNPASGQAPTPTMAAFLSWFPEGFAGTPSRATDAAVYCVVRGHGRTRVGGETLEWGPRDVFVTPSWAPVSHHAAEESIVFSISDRPAQQALGLWREAVG